MHLLHFNDPRLWQVAEPVTDIESQVIPHLAALDHVRLKGGWVTGLGLSAPQVGIGLRFFIFERSGVPVVAINPKITATGKHTKTSSEGCLSKPGWRIPVRRFREINVEYMTPNRTFFAEVLREMNARIFQHELDHLDGKNVWPRSVQ